MLFEMGPFKNGGLVALLFMIVVSQFSFENFDNLNVNKSMILAATR